MDIKTVRLDAAGHAALQTAYRDPNWGDVERSLLGFAYGRAREDAGKCPDAVESTTAANRIARRRVIWDSARWIRKVGDIASAFEIFEASAPSGFGSEVIFVVGLPRSGTTLVEQMLSAHPNVEGADELPELAVVIEQESRQRGVQFPYWVTQSNAADWQRLGLNYLERTRRWRVDKPIHVDKMPENWPYTPAIRAMLPGARIIDSRRDPVETGRSCFKQLVGPHRVGYSYDPKELALYWRDYNGFMMDQARLHPRVIRVQSHEALTANVEGEVREFLAFCGLEWDSACMRPDRFNRPVRTASAAQVLQPVKANTSITSVYGDALDDFRRVFSAASGHEGISDA